MRYSLIIPFIFLVACSTSRFQNVEIDSGIAFIGPEEPSICVSPIDQKKMVAGSNINNVYYSHDGGKTWIKDKLKSEAHGVYGDPVISADSSGNFYFFHLSDPAHMGWASDSLLDRIVCQRSEDGGKTWNDGGAMGIRHPKDQDKEWNTIDFRNGNIYVTWTEFDKYGSENPDDHSRIVFSKSTDNGDTWSEPLTLSQFEGDCIDSDSTTEGAVPCVSPNGNIYVAWSLGESIYFDRSVDEGLTWLETDKVIARHEGGWDMNIPGIQRCNGMPILKCDIAKTSSFKGRIYLNWVDTRNGYNNPDIFLKYSDDEGESWTEAIKVNQDTGQNYQFFTWMDVDPVSGYIYIVYYDRRDYDDNKTDVYLAVSRDGGNSFSDFKISESPFTPISSIFFGDYNNISAFNGTIRPIWTRFDAGRLSVWTSLISDQDLND